MYLSGSGVVWKVLWDKSQLFLGFPGCRDDPSCQKLRLQTRSPADFAFSDFEFEMSHLVVGLKVLYCNQTPYSQGIRS